MSKQKISIIGNGNVGGAIQRAAEKAGYEARTTIGKDAENVRSVGDWGDIMCPGNPRVSTSGGDPEPWER